MSTRICETVTQNHPAKQNILCRQTTTAQKHSKWAILGGFHLLVTKIWSKLAVFQTKSKHWLVLGPLWPVVYSHSPEVSSQSTTNENLRFWVFWTKNFFSWNRIFKRKSCSIMLSDCFRVRSMPRWISLQKIPSC